LNIYITKNKRGSAIIISLIILVVGLLITMFTIHTARKFLFLSKSLIDKLQVKLNADSTLEKLKYFASTGDFSYNYIINRDGPKFGFPAVIYVDGRTQHIGNSTFIKVEDAGSKINLLSPNFRAIKKLLLLNGVDYSKAVEVVNSLKDWYDKNSIRRLGGAESFYYRSKGYNYSPLNFGGIQSIYEFRLVKGINKRILNILKQYMTFSICWVPNINTMNKILLMSELNISDIKATQLINLRKNKGFLTYRDLNRITGRNEVFSFLSIHSSFSLDISISTYFNIAGEKKECSICFLPRKVTPFEVMECKE